MDRNTLSRWFLIAALAIGGYFLFGKITGGSHTAHQPIPDENYINAPDFASDPQVDCHDAAGNPEVCKAGDTTCTCMPLIPVVAETCAIKGNRFDAELSTRGAALTHFRLKDEQYGGMDMVSSNWDTGSWANLERWRPLRTLFRDDGANDQLKYDRFNWKLEKSDANNACKFTYTDDQVAIEKTIKAGDRPFELSVETTITNTSNAVKRHRFAIETFAFRKYAEVKSNFGRQSPTQTDMSCAGGNTVTRKNRDDFKEGWSTIPGSDRWGAVTSVFFAQALVPEKGGTPSCRLLAEDWIADGQKRDDDDAATVYHARLAYEPMSLEPGKSTTYTQVAFMGPKEREVLKTAGGTEKHLGDLLDLGFFSPVAKVLVGFLILVKEHVTGNWGLAIILLTIAVKLILFPLTWKSIKTTVAMRRLKPEMDDIAKKFADDMQAKNLATMELYKKRGVNPFGGCLPQLVQMPVWFAMYRSLQTAGEMYHTHFLWFKDLSAPDQLIGPFEHLPLLGSLPAIGPLPLILGGFMILQQRIVPQQGMDPMQQKMMAYLLPTVFTVMMLFLPAALGVYMLTNSILGIVQQLLVERFAPRDGGPKNGEIGVKEVPSSAKPAALSKGKARV